MAAGGAGESNLLTDSPGALARILDLADDAIISVNAEQRIVLFNQGAERIFGFSAKEMLGQPLDILLPERLAGVHRRHLQAFAVSPETARRMGDRREILGRRRDGSEFPAEASISKVDVGGRMMFTVILRDVTDRSAADQRIRASLREKEALLREIHHRVKNNLQVVSSLLGLQSRGVGDPLTRRMFEESQNRIHSMALLHESLYESADLSQVDFPAYIQQLAQHLLRSYGVAGDRIRLVTDLDDLRLTLDAAVPCGLIINELVSNSLKYAFPAERRGEIHLALKEIPGGQARLVVADDGIGLPAGIDIEKTRSLGLRLVRTLAQQLGAELAVQAAPGTTISLTFPRT